MSAEPAPEPAPAPGPAPAFGPARARGPVGAPGVAPAKRQPAWLESRLAGLLRIVVQRAVLKPLVRSPVRVEVVGRPAVNGPVVVVANHSSHLDAPLMVTFLPLALTRRLAVGAAADYFFDSKLRAILTGLVFNAFPIDRGKNRPIRGTSGRLLD